MLALSSAASLSFVPALRVVPTRSRAVADVSIVADAPLYAAANQPFLLRTIMSAASDAVDEICDVLPAEVCDDIEADADAVFSIIDENGDGAISRAELMEHLMKAGYKETAVNVLFEKLDTDKSESISKDELRAGFKLYTPLRSAPGLGAYNADFVKEIHQDADALFAAIDSDGNGAISKDELRDHLKTFSSYSFKAISNIFKLLDANKDGGIEKEELRSAFVKYSALRQAIGEGPNFK